MVAARFGPQNNSPSALNAANQSTAMNLQLISFKKEHNQFTAGDSSIQSW